LLGKANWGQVPLDKFMTLGALDSDTINFLPRKALRAINRSVAALNGPSSGVVKEAINDRIKEINYHLGPLAVDFPKGTP
jgi:hypothetical protein